jgi:transcription antitermination factor NusG
MHWYALSVRPQHEKAVADQLQAKELEAYLPVYRAKRRWSDRTKTIELPLFSHYTFCRFNFEQRLRVLQTLSVTSIVGFAGKPCHVSDQEIESIRKMVGSGLPLSPWPFVRLGQRVRICHGAMQGVEGILTREKSACRVVVNVELLNRAVAVEIERDMVCPVTDSAVKPLR